MHTSIKEHKTSYSNINFCLHFIWFIQWDSCTVLTLPHLPLFNRHWLVSPNLLLPEVRHSVLQQNMIVLNVQPDLGQILTDGYVWLELGFNNLLASAFHLFFFTQRTDHYRIIIWVKIEVLSSLNHFIIFWFVTRCSIMLENTQIITKLCLDCLEDVLLSKIVGKSPPPSGEKQSHTWIVSGCCTIGTTQDKWERSPFRFLDRWFSRCAKQLEGEKGCLKGCERLVKHNYSIQILPRFTLHLWVLDPDNSKPGEELDIFAGCGQCVCVCFFFGIHTNKGNYSWKFKMAATALNRLF